MAHSSVGLTAQAAGGGEGALHAGEQAGARAGAGSQPGSCGELLGWGEGLESQSRVVARGRGRKMSAA